MADAELSTMELILKIVCSLIGLRCRCGGEWTHWKPVTEHYTRAGSVDEVGIGHKTITFAKSWQERKCKVCGFIQQETLDMPRRVDS